MKYFVAIAKIICSIEAAVPMKTDCF